MHAGILVLALSTRKSIARIALLLINGAFVSGLVIVHGCKLLKVDDALG